MTDQVATVEHLTPVLDPPRAAAAPPPPVERTPSTLERLRLPMPADRLTGWVVTLLISGIAFALRLVNLGYPNKLIFDETYYAKDAYSLLRFGYERSWPDKANDSVTAGNPDVMLQGPSFIMHPPVGKWLIAGGEQLFGMNYVGWGFA